ncbi:translation elongation factor 4 [Candidatus Sneabacter namystus]|uniref:Elongation factor 4 n=1 Tax=Candidatus Sneabacter namystus TaxID=2601646 RepID=A0A5C0UJE5_9RICK|nr:translation elongation factor 4 [Candidatus Sneabacter namystus]QEK39592.1 elongation factor 4 [Candidatus Sneabacter namystus]
MQDGFLIRNFAIIAHIDHGKSTLADRLISMCEGLSEREMTAQVLDSMPLEKEKGITIKAQTVRLNYTHTDKTIYQLNLIDTPGHVDFSYEVSRSLKACEGSILLVDASQGIQAQTLAHLYSAIESNHEILPILNKIDLASAEPEQVKEQIQDVIGIDTSHALNISAKTGEGIDKLLQHIVEFLPSPKFQDGPLKALIIDSWYDQYLGVVTLVRIFQGALTTGAKIKVLASGKEYVVEKVGFFSPKKHYTNSLNAGEIGFLIAKIKQVSECKVGDTICDANYPNIIPLEGFKRQRPVVFCGIYPHTKQMFAKLQESLEKLSLNDSSLEFEKQTSSALGMGFRCGFLGFLHLEVIQDRLQREFDIDIITTAPNVVYKVMLKDKSYKDVHEPAAMPDTSIIENIHEPWVKATIITPGEFVGKIIQICEEKRGRQITTSCIGKRTMIEYELPLGEIIVNFYGKIKALSRGYASLDWESTDYKIGNLVKLNILLNGENVDALCTIVHKSNAESKGRELCLKLKELVPQHLFPIAIQASIGSRIVARETVKPLRKNVLAKCYGGDISRKRKLLEKQKEGKKKMKLVGNVNLPKSVFIDALKIE